MSKTAVTEFMIGQLVRQPLLRFRGVVFDVDPDFSNTEEWYQSIPQQARPRKDQPFCHLFAENSETQYIAYVSEQNLLRDLSGEPAGHPQIGDVFDQDENGRYHRRHTPMT